MFSTQNVSWEAHGLRVYHGIVSHSMGNRVSKAEVQPLRILSYAHSHLLIFLDQPSVHLMNPSHVSKKKALENLMRMHVEIRE